MKKKLLIAAAVTTALFLMSCDQPSSGSKNENNGVNKPSLPSKNENKGVNKPSLPENVGEDPFKGNTYASDSDKWVFSDDGKITQYEKDDEWSAKVELEYTYNEDTGLLTARVNKIQQHKSSGEYVLMTYDEALSQSIELPAFEEAFPREGWDDALEMVKSKDGWAEIYGVAENASEETIMRAYYNFQTQEFVKSLKKSYEQLYVYKAAIVDDELNCETYFPEDTSLEYVYLYFPGDNTDIDLDEGENIGIRLPDDENKTYFDITDFSSSQIKAKEEDGDKVITLSYTKEWEDGAFTLKVRAADADTEAILGKAEIELCSSNRPYYLEVVNTRQ